MHVVAYFLGIDGGGSKTTAVLGDETSVLASVTVGGSNITHVGEDRSRDALQEAMCEICRQAGIEPSQVTGVCAGIAGTAREEARKQVAHVLANTVPGKVEVVGDMVIAHEAALGGAPGIVVLAGTGSIAYARHASGQTARAGGWGFAISDEGSGHWIGVQAVAAIAHARDEGRHTKLSDRVLERWSLISYDDLMRHANSSPAPKFAELFPVVLATAEAGDSQARDILIRAGVKLAGLAQVVFRRLWSTGDAIEIALAGGIFENSGLVCEAFKSDLRSSIPQARISLSARSAAEGALALARKRPQCNPTK